MQDPKAPESLRQFQITYGRYLRAPAEQILPEGIPERRSEVYEGLLFNNICGFLDRCFPVTQSIVGAEKWRVWCRQFFKEWRSETPLFSQIPFEFVRYMSEMLITDSLPDWMPELLHYEWVELEVDVDNAERSASSLARYYVNPNARLLAYNWPVHRIRKDFQPTEPEASFLVVYRDSNFSVMFSEINATTYALLSLIQEGYEQLPELFSVLAETIGHPDAEALMQFGVPLLEDLKRQEIILGEHNETVA
jgi:hypothetical protein